MARRNTQYEEDGIRLLPTPTPTSFPHHDVSLVNVESDSIPWGSLLPILFLRLADGMVYGVIFPFITAYLISLDAPRDKIGLYAGLAEGSLMGVEALLATTWASLADKYGRRPCMLWGLVSNLIACGALGFSTSVWQIILWRAACGLYPGGVLQKIMAGEISNSSNRDRVFAIYSPTWVGGFMLSTFIGGELSAPYGHLPEPLSGNWELWKTYPYALPCLICSFTGLLALLYGNRYLPETRPPVEDKLEVLMVGRPSQYYKLRATLSVPRYAPTLCVFLFFQITYFSYDALFAVCTYTQVAAGGLGLPVATIGRFYALFSGMHLIATPFLLPFLRRMMGTRKALTMIALAWVGTAVLVPISQRAALNESSLLWPVLASQQTLKNIGTLAWPMCDIAMMNLFESYPELLATASATTLMAGALGRAAGPTLAGWSFSASGEYNGGTLGRQLPWMLLLAMALPPVFLVPLLEDMPPTSRINETLDYVTVTGTEDDDSD